MHTTITCFITAPRQEGNQFEFCSQTTCMSGCVPSDHNACIDYHTHGYKGKTKKWLNEVDEIVLI